MRYDNISVDGPCYSFAIINSVVQATKTLSRTERTDIPGQAFISPRLFLIQKYHQSLSTNYFLC